MANALAIAQILAAIIQLEEDEEYESRNMLRVQRLHLRDASNPFDIPEAQFIELYRLPAAFIIQVIMPRMAPHLEPSGANIAAVPAHLIVNKNVYFLQKKLLLQFMSQVLMGINYLSRGTYQRELGQDYMTAMAQSTVSKNLEKFTTAFQTEFLHGWVQLPTEEEKVASKALYKF